jgi:LemA protein
MLTSGLKSVFAIAENYPDLKANTNFIELQKQLAETEDQISAARRIYNGNVSDFNASVQSFPASIVAGMHNMRSMAFFQMDAAESAKAEKVPSVSF